MGVTSTVVGHQLSKRRHRQWEREREEKRRSASGPSLYQAALLAPLYFLSGLWLIPSSEEVDEYMRKKEEEKAARADEDPETWDSFEEGFMDCFKIGAGITAAATFLGFMEDPILGFLAIAVGLTLSVSLSAALSGLYMWATKDSRSEAVTEPVSEPEPMLLIHGDDHGQVDN